MFWKVFACTVLVLLLFGQMAALWFAGLATTWIVIERIAVFVWRLFVPAR